MTLRLRCGNCGEGPNVNDKQIPKNGLTKKSELICPKCKAVNIVSKLCISLHTDDRLVSKTV